MGSFSQVTRKATSSVKWSTLMEAVSRTASPIIYVILARLLAPEDFGVLATALIAVTFSQIFWEAGLGKALIQTKEPPDRAANVVFWSNLVLSGGVYGILFLAAPWLAEFFDSPPSKLVLRILGLQIIIGSAATVQQALFERDLGFRQLFWIKLVTAFFPALFSIPMAILGCGVWALVAGALAGSVLDAILLWQRSFWRPTLDYDWLMARRLFRFGAWVFAESLIAWFMMWGDNLIVGGFLGVEDLGVYRIGCSISVIVYGLILNPFLPVLYPAFSRMQDDPESLKEVFRKANRVVISLALPAGVLFLLTGTEWADFIFGEKWHGLGFVMSVLGFMHGMAWLVGINPDLYRAMGRPDVITKLSFAVGIFYLPAFLVAAPFGLHVFTVVRLCLAAASIPVHLYLAGRMLKVSPFYLWTDGRPMFLAALSMFVAILVVKGPLVVAGGPNGAPLVVMILSGLGLGIYGGMIWLLDRDFVLQTKGLLRRAIGI